MDKENISQDKLIVFIKSGILPFNIDELEARVGKNMELIQRPLYGLQLVEAVRHDILKMIQIKPIQVYKTYYYFEPWNNCRVYAEQHENGISTFMVSVGKNDHLFDFAKLTKF